jgi:hypothetical protein
VATVMVSNCGRVLGFANQILFATQLGCILAYMATMFSKYIVVAVCPASLFTTKE